MSLLISWSEPELCTCDYDLRKAWFVYFDIKNELTGQVLRKQFRGDVNTFTSKTDRIEEGNALKAYWADRLKKGNYNPWQTGANAMPATMPEKLEEALAKILALKEVSLKKKSFRGYRQIHDMFLEWLKRFNYHKLRLYQFTPMMAQSYLDFLLLEKRYSGKSHNTHHGILHAFFSSMMVKGRQWIKENPFAGIQALPEDQGDNIPYTDEERVSISNYLREHDKQMYYAINFLFHCFIRKTELTTIRVGDIDWRNKTIKINSQAAKNRIQDSVTIPEAFISILREMGLDKEPKHHFIFGKKMRTCAVQMSRADDISDRYLRHKVAMGYAAGDGKTFYSWKHTGAIAYWNVLKDPYSLMRQLRHGDLKTTMIYLRSLGLNPNYQFLSASVKL